MYTSKKLINPTAGKATIRMFFMLMIIPLIFFTGCKSSIKTRDFDKSTLYGMLYDYDNKPCFGAEIYVDESEEAVQTDISGRFILVDLKKGTHQITVKLDNYEELSISYDYIDKTHILYLKIISFNQLLRFAEESLEGKKYYETDDYLTRAEAIQTDNPVAVYLRALYFIETNKIDEAVNLLQKSVSAGNNQPVFYLTLADIYQYRLNDIPSAISQLEKYLKRVDDPEVMQRLEQLSSML
jgi:hypothetical protein